MVFTAYGFFYLSFAFALIFPAVGYSYAPDNDALGYFCIVWLIFTVIIFLVALKQAPLTLTLTFFLLVATYAVLAAHFFVEDENEDSILIAAGYVGVVCGVTAMYNGTGFLVNDLFGKRIIPLFERKQFDS